MAVRMISNPEDVAPTFAVDSVEDLEAIVADGYDDQGIAALVMKPSAEVYMLDGQKRWVKL